jgi:hypothetical protein
MAMVVIGKRAPKEKLPLNYKKKSSQMAESH